ncbi:MAG: Dabb family protein [Bacilli bacterium]
MVEHLCVYRIRQMPDADIENEIVRLFQKLKGEIEGLLEMSVGINTTEEVEYLNGYTVGLRMLFDSRHSLKNYLEYPKHKAVADFVLKSVDDVIVCDFEV